MGCSQFVLLRRLLGMFSSVVSLGTLVAVCLASPAGNIQERQWDFPLISSLLGDDSGSSVEPGLDLSTAKPTEEATTMAPSDDDMGNIFTDIIELCSGESDLFGDQIGKGKVLSLLVSHSPPCKKLMMKVKLWNFIFGDKDTTDSSEDATTEAIEDSTPTTTTTTTTTTTSTTTTTKCGGLIGGGIFC